MCKGEAQQGEAQQSRSSEVSVPLPPSERAEDSSSAEPLLGPHRAPLLRTSSRDQRSPQGRAPQGRAPQGPPGGEDGPLCLARCRGEQSMGDRGLAGGEGGME